MVVTRICRSLTGSKFVISPFEVLCCQITLPVFLSTATVTPVCVGTNTVLFFWSFVIAISSYLFLKAKAYYAIGLYPVLLAFGSVYLERLLLNGWKRYLRPVVFFCNPGLIRAGVFDCFPYKNS